MSRKRSSEVHAYRFILDDLETIGWNRKQIYTQNECLDNQYIAEKLGLLRPENVVKITEREYYVIEAKAERRKIGYAIREAEEDYGNKINTSKHIKTIIISGVAGNQNEGYIVKSKFLENGIFKTIKVNGYELTSFVSPKIAQILINSGKAEIEDLPANEREFLRIADKINSILHEGSISADSRGSIMASLILTFLDETPIDINQEASVLVASINAKVNAVLHRSGKPDFYTFLEIKLPRPTTNHFKFKQALVTTFQELKNLNIPSAMNSGDDILGKFFEVFLKYGNWAKDVGIVFTPRHITKFATEVLDVNKNDIVYDPTCGTGGFLVATFDHIRRKYPKDIERFRKNNIFGTENQDGIIALAIVNMIFRNDGKTNMEGHDCFARWLNLKRANGLTTAEFINEDKLDRIPPVTKVLMNPPFAQPSSENKEYKFIEHALKQMQKGGILFSILPSPVMVKQGRYLNWRRDSLLRENTLLAVIDFPDDLFYPVGTVTCGIIIKKGKSSQENQKVLWIKVSHDGLLKSKGKRLPTERERNEFQEIQELVKSFIKDQTIEVHNIKEFQKAVPIDMTDNTLELLPEVYLDEKKPSRNKLNNSIEKTLREAISFMVKDDRMNDFKQNVIDVNPTLFKSIKKEHDDVVWKETLITDIFQKPLKTGDYHVSKELDEGEIPLVSCSTTDNGFEGKFDVPKENTIKNAITITSDGQPLASFYHYYPFVSKDNVIQCIPTKQYRFTTMLFFTMQLNKLQWRFSYGRKCYLNKIHKIKIYLPFKSKNEIDEDYIECLFKQSSSWEILKKLFSDK